MQDHRQKFSTACNKTRVQNVNLHMMNYGRQQIVLGKMGLQPGLGAASLAAEPALGEWVGNVPPRWVKLVDANHSKETI